MRIVDARRTSVVAAILRASHQVLDHEPRIFDDPLAVGLVDGSTAEEIRRDRRLLEDPMFRAARCLITYRSRYVEEQLREAVARGVGQYVLVGAGFDTFAYRQPEWARGLRVIEVDHPDSQAVKHDLLRRRNIEVPDNVAYCPADLEVDGLEAGLAAGPFDPRTPAFFSWLGVTVYLRRDAVDMTLRYIATLRSPSTIAFTFNLPRQSLQGFDRDFHDFGRQVGAQRGEPCITFHEAEPLRRWLEGNGFRDVCHLEPEVADQRYCAGRRDGLRVPRMQQLMLATV